MEKAVGRQLFEVWDKIDELNRLALIKQLTILESQLASIHFPAIGSLYFRQSVAGRAKYIPLSSDIDPSSSYCVGPSCDRSWQLDQSKNALESGPDGGPWSSISSYGKALAEREISRILQTPKPDKYTMRQDTADEQIALIQAAINFMKVLDSAQILQGNGEARLWHTDLHMGNIFVSDKDWSQIVSIIDWQSVLINPMFLQARWPVFLDPPKNYMVGFVKPKLPDNFDQLNPDDQKLAEYEWKQATQTKAYEISSFLNNRKTHTALNVPRVFQELFVRCGEVWEEGSIPLRACLIEIYQKWDQFDLPDSCPFAFQDDEVKAHELEFKSYEKWHTVQAFAREYLDTDLEGWIPPSSNLTIKQEQNVALFESYLRQMDGSTSREDLLRIWPFPLSL